jgi:hypothetical protein
MPTVYVLQKPTNQNVDLSDAERFGDIKYIIGTDYIPSLRTSAAMQAMRDGLKDFQSTDYLLSTHNDPISTFMGGLVLCEIGYEGPIQWLRFIKKRNEQGMLTVQTICELSIIDYSYEDEEQ